MIKLKEYLKEWLFLFPKHNGMPWEITSNALSIILGQIRLLSNDFVVKGDCAIHKGAVIEENVVLKGPLIVEENCFIGAHAYLRGGVYLGRNVCIGPGCEIKSSFVLTSSKLAHFNFVGDSLIGSHVNLEAGAVFANHYNERDDKMIYVTIEGKRKSTNVTKFGALVGDHSKVGANAVLSPGTILNPGSIIARLSLVEQN